MTTDYKGKTVLVTGGAGGIGSVLAKGYADLGARVIIADKAPAGADYAAGIGAFFHHINLADARACEEMMVRLFVEYGHIDVLINNAGLGQNTPLDECPVELWDYILSVNLRAPFILSREFFRYYKQNGYTDRYGRIVNMSSSRYIMSEPHTEPYSASKGGIVSLTHALAASTSGYKITVNAISPGWICNADYEALTEAEHRQHTSGRVGRPEDILAACLYLTGEGNEFINGQNITVDGGMTKKMIYDEIW